MKGDFSTIRTVGSTVPPDLLSALSPVTRRWARWTRRPTTCCPANPRETERTERGPTSSRRGPPSAPTFRRARRATRPSDSPATAGCTSCSVSSASGGCRRRRRAGCRWPGARMPCPTCGATSHPSTRLECRPRSPHQGVPGAADRAPHPMVQELLNRSDDHLWAILTNGRKLRLLRDSTNLTGLSYVEFDLETMFAGDVFSDFVVLYLLLHESRFEVAEGQAPGPASSSVGEPRCGTWEFGRSTISKEGVSQAVELLGTGFLQHRANVTPASSSKPATCATTSSTANCSDWSIDCSSFVAEERPERDLLLNPEVTPPNVSAGSPTTHRSRCVAEPGAAPHKPRRRVASGLGRHPSAGSGRHPRARCAAAARLFARLARDPHASAGRRHPGCGSVCPCAPTEQRRAAGRGARHVGDPAQDSRSASSTSADSGPRNSAASTSRCWSECPGWTWRPVSSPSRWPRATTGRRPGPTPPTGLIDLVLDEAPRPVLTRPSGHPTPRRRCWG